MYCHKCGKQIPDGAEFCTYCGTRQNAAAPRQSESRRAAPEPTQQRTGPRHSEPSVRQPEPTLDRPPAKGKKENIPLGIIGALIGVILAFYGIIICEIIGLWGILAGLFAAASVLFGYQALGRKLGNVGIVICAILVCGVVWFGNLVTWCNAVGAIHPGYAKLEQSIVIMGEMFAEYPGLSNSYRITLALRLGSAILGVVLITLYTVRTRRFPEEYQPKGGRFFLGVIAAAVLLTGICVGMGGEPEPVEEKRNHAMVEMRKYLEEENQRIEDLFGVPYWE